MLIQMIAKNLKCIRQNKCLFADLSLQLKCGELLLVSGPNGSGKSSLLKLLAGLNTPMGGEIFWQNKLLQAGREEFTAQLHYMGHENGLRQGLTVAENLQMACQLASLQHVSLDKILEDLQLIIYKNVLARNLSAGQKRRVALAKLFLMPKCLWILDEPTTALDDATQKIFLSKLEEHLGAGGIAIISSHHPIQLEKHTSQMLRLGIC